jgi:amino acid permease
MLADCYEYGKLHFLIVFESARQRRKKKKKKLLIKISTPFFEINSEGVTHARYHHAVRHILDRKSAIIISTLQTLQLVLIGVAYTITGASSIVEIGYLSCSLGGMTDEEISNTGRCLSQDTGGQWKSSLMFGALELVLSQFRNLEECWFLSAIGTVGSLTYALIALILSLANAKNGLGTIEGIPIGFDQNGTIVSTADKAFGMMNALGSLSFAYGFSVVLVEIEDTLKQPPAAAKSMKKSVNIAVTGAFVFYALVAFAGYAALGNSVSALVLQSFTGPKWALLIAELAVLAHMSTAFQIFLQSIFNTVESHLKWKFLQDAANEVVEKLSLPPLASETVAAETGEATGVVTPPTTDAKTATENSPPAMASPFDAPADLKSKSKKGTIQFNKTRNLGLDHVHLEPLAERMSSLMSGQMSERQVSVLLEQLHCDEAAVEARIKENHQGGLATAKSSMFAADTGFANENVPLNEDNVFVPLKWRLLLRSIIVLLVTLVATCLPFFSAFLGVVGTISFWPMTVYYPFKMYRKVKPVSPGLSRLMTVITVVMGVVCVATLVAAIRTIVEQASSFTFFQT